MISVGQVKLEVFLFLFQITEIWTSTDDSPFAEIYTFAVLLGNTEVKMQWKC